MLCEMQTASSRFWTRVTESISYDDNRYAIEIEKIKRKNETDKERDIEKWWEGVREMREKEIEERREGTTERKKERKRQKEKRKP